MTILAQTLPRYEGQISEPPFRTLLSGSGAFYQQPHYVETTRREFALRETLPPTYTWDTEYKIVRLVKTIFALLFFPITLLKKIAGLFIVPASLQDPKFLPGWRKDTDLNSTWKYKRITIEVDGYHIDAMIMGQASTLGNGRWILGSNGNGEFYESRLSSYDFQQVLTQLNGNAIVFNYPGVGASSGGPDRSAMAKAYRAVLAFLEDKSKGIGAIEVIGYGLSLGGGVQGEALTSHELQEGVRYVFIKDRTFAHLSGVVSTLIHSLLGFLTRVLGWNISSVESSKSLKAPEIILQTANVESYQLLTDSSRLVDDGIISAEDSLAKALLDDPESPRRNKRFIGIPEGHNDGIRNPAFLAQQVEELLRSSSTSIQL